MAVRLRINEAVTGRVRTAGRRGHEARWRVLPEVYIGQGRWKALTPIWCADRERALVEIQASVPQATLDHVWDGCVLYWGSDPDSDSEDAKMIQASAPPLDR